MANIDIKYKGLTGQIYDLTIDDGQTMTQLLSAIATDEQLDSSYYYNVALHNDLSITKQDNSSDTLASIGATTGTLFITKPVKTGTREARQTRKLEIAQEKRQADGDTSANFYKLYNTYDRLTLSLAYDGDDLLSDGSTVNPLQTSRPWLGGSVIPRTVEQAVDPDTFASLEGQYDASVNTFIKPPGATDGTTITQWVDQSDASHNLNSTSSKKPAWYSNVKNSLGALRYDGVDDCLNINPVAYLDGIANASFYIVLKPTQTTGDTAMGTDTDEFKVFSDAGKWKVGMGGITASETSPGTDADISAGSWYYIGVIYDGNAGTDTDKLKLRINGTAVALDFSSGVSLIAGAGSTKFEVGCSSNSNFFAGDIAEFFIFDATLASNEITNVETYLSTKWSI
jgi:hypothetical protein